MPDFYLRLEGTTGESTESKSDDTFDFKATEGTDPGIEEIDFVEVGGSGGGMEWDNTKHIQWESHPQSDEAAPVDPAFDHDFIA